MLVVLDFSNSFEIVAILTNWKGTISLLLFKYVFDLN